MFKIPRIEKSSFYVDHALKNMEEYASVEKDKIQLRFSKIVSSQRKSKEEINLNKRKDLELQKVRYVNDKLNNYLRTIIRKFPELSQVDEIYVKLIDTSEVNSKKIREYLRNILDLANSIDDLSQKTEHKLKRAKTHTTQGFIMGKFLGKVNSMFEKESKSFLELETARKFINKLPTFEDLYTISIGGFPNVGKSTLMNKISGSDVEIQNYPFTTKGLMFGYIHHNSKKAIQLIDTPGLLNREIRNSIEERAEIILNEYCDRIVFVLDITESCGYSLEKQLELLEKVKENKKEIMIYLSKTDIYNNEHKNKLKQIKTKLKNFEFRENSEKLKEELIEIYLNHGNKFDPKKLKIIR